MEYLLKVSAVVAIFYLIYIFLLQKDTFFESNRWFLLVGLIAAFSIPFIIIPIYIEQAPIQLQNFNLPYLYNDPNSLSNAKAEELINILDYLLLAYALGVFFFSLHFVLQLLSVKKVIRKSSIVNHLDYKFAKSKQSIAPFSFFKWIVYNPDQFKDNELEQILNHEKIHVKQYHSIDVLITHISCILLWFNPFIWLYRASLKQNLEFIADKYAQKQSTCKKDYQYALLKSSIPTHQLAITNNFYTSLIKKRIVMLQKSKSKKINLIKYAFVIPLLAVFLMSFNTEEVYLTTNNLQTNKQDSTSVNSIKIVIDKNLNDNDLEEIKEELIKDSIYFTYKKLKRNTKKEIISISTKFENKNGGAATWNSFNNDNKPIKSFYFFKSENEFGVKALEKTIPSNKKTSSSQISYSFTENHDVGITGKSQAGVIINTSVDGKTPLYILDGKEITEKEMKALAPEDIKEINVLKGELAIEKYGNKGKNGVIEIITKNSKRKTNNIIDTSMKDLKVIGYGNPALKEGNKAVSHDSILFNKTNDTITSTPWKTTIGINAEKNNDNKINLTSIDGKEPLFIVDNIEITKKELQEINPNAIESVNVFKDKSATEKYGEKGKNGVVVIATKKINQTPWKVTAKRNTNVIFATKDTIYIKAKQHILKQLANGFDKQPLYLLDGKEVNSKIIATLDEMKVERISHIKNSEIAIKKYGERARNGVIETTSRTKNSKTPIVKVVGSAIYIVNGKKISSNDFDKINPNEIKSISILKDRKAIKKYGDKSKNSIIKVILKK